MYADPLSKELPVNDLCSYQVKEQSRNGHGMQHMWSIDTAGFSEADINYNEK